MSCQFRHEPAVTQDAERAPIRGSWKGSRPNREERILADLVQHPEQIEQASEAINAKTFTAAARDGLFQAISAVYKRGEPVDAVTVAWELDRIQSEGHRNIAVDPAAYVDRLAAIPVEPGTAQKTAAEDQRVAERQARARQAAGPTRGGVVAERPISRHVGHGHSHDVQHRPPKYDPPSPGVDRHGPWLGF